MIDFETLYHHAAGRQLLGRDKLQPLYELMGRVWGLFGQAAEVGVWQGGTTLFMALAMPDRQVLAYDTFTGMPFADPVDVHQPGEFICRLDDVANLMIAHGARNVTLRQGVFPDSIRDERNDRYAFVHLDGDQYQTTRDALEFYYPRMVAGGIIVLDDYAWPYCPGVRQATEEFLASRLERPVHISPHQAYITRGTPCTT